ncbi:MAG: dipeptide ABC transporter ATP-binding protein [Bifidobacteriaceae bacterium]|nr:dipeptide ABC transporter ATP-binding protein [Bifidobacteriaceae bacterium]
MAVSALSFLGYGVVPPQPEWGSLINAGRNYLATAWWMTTLPGLVVVAVVLSANRLGRWVDRAFARDERQRGRGGRRDALSKPAPPPALRGPITGTKAGSPATDAQPPTLDIVGLSVDYVVRGQRRPAVRDASLWVDPGQTVALVGESGSGKTTLAHAVAGLLPGRAEARSEHVHLGELSIGNWTERQLSTILGKRIGFVPQDPTVSLNPVQRIGPQVVEALGIHGSLARRQRRERALEILRAAGLDNPESLADRYPHELSGGQLQRVLIGIALSCGPELVIADEPTSGLDVTVQKAVLDHLQHRTQAAHVSLLLITHDLALAAERADRVVVMKDGEIVERGPARAVLDAPRHPYTALLRSSAPGFHSSRALARREYTPPSAEAAAQPLIEATNLVKTFPARGKGAPVRAVDHVSFRVARSRTTALVGSSGSGKTTTARLVLRLEEPDSGTVALDGIDITRLAGPALLDLRRRVTFVHQNPFDSLNPRMGVGAIIEAPLRAFGIGDASQRRRRVRELLDAVALPSGVAAHPPTQLSGGQRQRVAIARALAPSPNCVVLDEPVSALDVSVQAQILDLLNELQNEFAVGYLFITHDLAVVAEVADEVHVMESGRIVESGATGDVLARPNHPYTSQLLSAAPGWSLRPVLS